MLPCSLLRAVEEDGGEAGAPRERPFRTLATFDDPGVGVADRLPRLGAPVVAVVERRTEAEEADDLLLAPLPVVGHLQGRGHVTTREEQPDPGNDDETSVAGEPGGRRQQHVVVCHRDRAHQHATAVAREAPGMVGVLEMVEALPAGEDGRRKACDIECRHLISNAKMQSFCIRQKYYSTKTQKSK